MSKNLSPLPFPHPLPPSPDFFLRNEEAEEEEKDEEEEGGDDDDDDDGYIAVSRVE